MALTGSEQASQRLPLWLARPWSRLKARIGETDVLMQRLAGTMFLIRVAAAAMTYGSQVLLARWMGSFEFGIYAYVWTWVLLIGQAIDLGLAAASQRFIPEYREHKFFDLLRGYIFASRWLAVGMAVVIALVCAGIIRLLQPWLDHYTVIPLYLACITLPAYALANTQDGISRSYDWVGLAITPTYIVRQFLLTVFMAAAYFGGLPVDAVTAMILAGVAIWLSALGQRAILNRRLAVHIEPGARAYAFRPWLAAALPILMVESFYLLLGYVDVLVLQQFRPPDEVAIYYAAVKTLALISFFHWAVSATSAHRFSSYHAAGDRTGLSAFFAQCIRWTLWPTLVATAILLAFGKPLLSLFGSQFTEGYHLLFVLAIGLLARAAIGPVERLLNMIGEQRICALIYAAAFVLNFALCLLLIPSLGAAGAASATAIALVSESVLLFAVTKKRLGLHAFIWGRGSPR